MAMNAAGQRNASMSRIVNCFQSILALSSIWSLGIHNPFHEIVPHVTQKIVGFPQSKDGRPFQGRGVAWSPDGRWCVVVGECLGYEASMALFEREIDKSDPEVER